MAKVKKLIALILFLTSCYMGWGQSYTVSYKSPSGDTTGLKQQLGLQSAFTSQGEATKYIFALPALLQSKGYIASSVDSVRYDSLHATVTLFTGSLYKWTKISTRPQDQAIIEAVRLPEEVLSGRVDFTVLRGWQQKILDYLEDNGHPFGKVYLDSIGLQDDQVTALLRIDQGPVYKIDSIRVYGDAKVSNEFLQRYLDIPNGSLYSRTKLLNISRRLSEVNYLTEEKTSDLTLLGTGSILNLYLKAKKNNQFNVLVGLLPNSDQLTGNKKLLLTVDANILLRNALGSGETIGLIWQQLQQKSPRLDLLFEQPYAFHSPFGINFNFGMYKRDSSYLNINMNLGTSYRLGDRQSTGVFIQRLQTIASPNTDVILITHELPKEADVSSFNLGITYTFNNTDFRFNPARGNEFVITSIGGNKKIKKNTEVLDLKDPNDPGFDFESLYDTLKLKAYQFRITTAAAHYFPLGTQSTVKLGMNAGIYQSANYFRNELFQIGGFKLLRGFDEESQFVSQYAIGTAEYRYRLGTSSYFFAFADGGWGKHLLETTKDHSYFGTGLGLAFETKAGIINFAWAVGKRDDTQINLRQSKVHLGLVSYF
jgi:outer membrane protein assembly factor BamA